MYLCIIFSVILQIIFVLAQFGNNDSLCFIVSKHTLQFMRVYVLVQVFSKCLALSKLFSLDKSNSYAALDKKDIR